MEYAYSIVDFFEKGGLFMYPIAVVLVLTLAIALERFLFLWKATRENSRFWSDLSAQLKVGNFSEAEQMTAGSKVAAARVLNGGFEQRRVDPRRSELEQAVEDGLLEILPTIERRTHYLATFSNVATLLGLLGTVLGLITAFSALGSADPVEKANMLSAGISEAMSCTAFGLMVAIPALLLHSWLQSKTMTLIDSLEAVSARFVRLGSGQTMALAA
ncbi:MotA/TolQ/ExbB proton channel family protein [Spongiibacter nanhainus]|uniref:MotA/TolQ/ExbB proton channel family protein n=1 Tax=Spongiibacter nanhainus TaxID=2794344 RepID=A0A7T4R1U5_9GAMM|nr:MotA/TolQ/ExbB proton channel family protein [Spongiibacter nanhainus]QQD18883.1 MotA/TolQ/ExbB proton channel family protein [Spongiibacter nanhainus]